MRVFHLFQAHTYFVDSPVARQQMSVAIIDLATLGIHHLKLARVTTSLREKKLRFITALNADHLRDDRKPCKNEERDQDQGTDGVLLSHTLARPSNFEPLIEPFKQGL